MPIYPVRQVFRCFKWLESKGDWLMGAAGPIFVTLGVILLSVGVICFFNVVQPTLPLPWLTTPMCVLFATNLVMHYYYVCTVPPGFVDDPPRESGTGWLWARRRPQAHGGVQWSGDVHITKAAVTRCGRCGVLRPEVMKRAHHCRICNRCVLKYDHHCPVRVNQCVGLHNERHFVLFLVYLVFSTFSYATLGWPHLWSALGWYDDSWPHLVPAVSFLLLYILSSVLCFAVSIMVSWHIWSIANAETSTEAHDHEEYRRLAKGRGETFINSYDVGKRKNLELFFNLGKDGYPYYTLIFPLRIEPYTDGRFWARKEGYEWHRGVRKGEELTDEEE